MNSRPLPPSQRRVFVDTAAFYALGDPRDDNAEGARSIYDRLEADHWRLFITSFVLAETHALCLTRLRHLALPVRIRHARQLLRNIYESSTTIIRASAADEQRAWDIIDRFQDKDFSFTDATSFAVMERLHIIYAFTFDDHFAQYRFVPLTAT